jgi:hypothetical protein
MALITADALAAWPNPWVEMKYASVGLPACTEFFGFIKTPFLLAGMAGIGLISRQNNHGESPCRHNFFWPTN